MSSRREEREKVFKIERLENKVFALGRQIRVLQNAKNEAEKELNELKSGFRSEPLIRELILSLH